MKVKITLIILFFSIVKSYACSCEPKRDFKSQEFLNFIDFIMN